jgi:uncharacterized membrane protein YbhN (UPF0104 family)
MKRWARVVGVILALIAGGFFVVRARQALSGQNLSTLLDVKVLLASGLLIFVYAFAIPVTGLAWSWLLRMLGQRAKFGEMTTILAVTQFGKYLPGNVAQHIGRIALARSANIALPAIVLSITYETLLSVVACTHLTALTFLWTMPAAIADWKIVQYREPALALITITALAAFFIVPRLATHIANRRAAKAGVADETTSTLQIRWAVIVACYVFYVLNFCLTGTGLWIVSHALMEPGQTGPTLLFMTGAFASTWILGFLAPGAPAGLGVREGVLAVWLNGVMHPSQAITLILVLRIATTVGDLANFVVGSLFMSQQRKRASRANA